MCRTIADPSRHAGTQAAVQLRRDDGGFGRFAPGDLHAIDPRAHALGDGREALAELSGHDDQHVVARAQHVGEGRLHGAGPRRTEEEDIAHGAEDAPQPGRGLGEDGVEFRPAMIEHRLRQRRAHPFGHGGRPRQAQAIPRRNDVEPGRRLADVHGTSCPDYEVRLSLQHPPTRTSESKGTSIVVRSLTRSS
jgi:hypothetical protein